LGQLRLWAGGVVALDRDVVFGRRPHPIDGTSPEPRLVKIDDPGRDVSSQHCLVHVDDWSVTVTDLGSTNGSFLTPAASLPGRAATTRLLNPDEAVELTDGDRVRLAESFDFVFEVT
jgi:predicted component of type VI protein secretion system